MNIFTFGETVYDIIFKNNQPVAAKAGGSMLNTSVSLGRIGLNVNFVSDLGKDNIGDNIMNFLTENNVCVNLIERYENRNTAIAIAFLNDLNDASYTFYKDFPENRLSSLIPGFEKGDIVLFGSFFAITESIRPVLLKFLEQARKSGCIIIYDPNFRSAHLNELAKLKPFILENIAISNIVRGSDDDFKYIFAANKVQEAYDNLKLSGCCNLIYTANRNNVIMMTENQTLSVAVPEIMPVSTIGAGDNFNAGLIWTLVNKNISKNELGNPSPELMKEILLNGISFSSEVCMNYDNYISWEFASRVNKSK